MKKTTIIAAVAIAFTIAFSVQGFATDHKHEHAKGTQEAGHSKHTKTEHKISDHMGVKIHESTVDGYKFMYELIDMKDKMKNMKNMPADMKSHHLMVYVRDSHGHKLGKAKVGYLVKGPGKSEQKAMCMGMGGGFGSDVNLSEKGTYTVITKVASGDKKLMDKFDYEVK